MWLLLLLLLLAAASCCIHLRATMFKLTSMQQQHMLMLVAKAHHITRRAITLLQRSWLDWAVIPMPEAEQTAAKVTLLVEPLLHVDCYNDCM